MLRPSGFMALGTPSDSWLLDSDSIVMRNPTTLFLGGGVSTFYTTDPNQKASYPKKGVGYEL